jgi:uncharacterized membrane protein (DUF4010 family)
MDRELVASLGVALAVGLLVGLERQMAIAGKDGREHLLGGVRTFPLIALMGAVSTLIARALGVWIGAAALLGLVALIAVYRITLKGEDRVGGVTTEIAALVTWLLGALAVSDVVASFGGRLLTVAALGVVTTLLLSVKPRLHALVSRISNEDIFATLQILVVAVVVYPLLPDEGYGPFDAVNPRQTGRMVLFVGGLSFVGYVASRLLGPGRGLTLTGVVGGLVSSTAVTFSMSRRARGDERLTAPCALAIVIASTVMFARVLVLAGAIHLQLALRLAAPLVAMGAAGLLFVWLQARPVNQEKQATGDVELKNPFELRSAIIFGLLFSAVIFVVKAARETLGDAALYGAAVLAGTTDVDAITLSTASLAKGGLELPLASLAIVLAAISNTTVKGGIAFVTGGRALGMRVAGAFLAMAVAGVIAVVIQRFL